MRWFKHMTSSLRDRHLSALISEHGMEAYGFYWGMVELVAEQVQRDSIEASAEFTLSQWSRMLHCNHKKASKYLDNLGVRGVITVESSGENIRVSIPSLLNLKDDYSRKSGHYPDKVRTHKDVDRDKDVDNNPLQSPKGDVSAEGSAKLVAKAEAVAERSDIAGKQFAEFWSASWKRGSKAQAEKSFRRIVASAGFGSLLASVVKFAEAYATVPEDKRPHVATWLNQRRYEQPVTDFVAAPGSDPASGSDDWVNWLANLPPN